MSNAPQSLNLNVLEAEYVKEDSVEGSQRIVKLTEFVDELKAAHPQAKRFDIYLFTDCVDRFANPWTDTAASIYAKPVLVVVSMDPKPVLLSCEHFDTEYETSNWAIAFNESRSRQIDTSATVNILKVLPEVQMLNANRYYQSRLMKPGMAEQRFAKLLEEQIHASFPVFKKTRVQQTSQASTETSIDELTTLFKLPDRKSVV
jgi:hypothetical protein